MILSSNAKMLAGFIAVFVLSYTSLVAGQTLTGNEIITELHDLSYVYEDFVSLVRRLPSSPYNNNTDAQSVVDQYVNITNSQLERFEIGNPNPQVALEDATQYGVASAIHILVVLIRRFFIALTAQRDFFTQAQRVVLSDTVQAQNRIVDPFLRDAPKFAPKVLDILQRDLGVVKQSYASTSDALRG